MKKLSIALLLVFAGCSSTHVNAPAPPGAAAARAPLIPAGVAVTVQDDASDSTLTCAPLQGLPVHGDSENAFRNLTSASQTRASVVGYGSPGKLCTGRAGQCATVTTAMNIFDVNDWSSFAQSIQGKFSRLTVLACNVGQCDDGAAFITRLAEETKTRVRAPTGLVWCQDDTLTLDPDNEWIEARPGRPAKAKCPPHVVPVLENYNLFLNGQWKEVPVRSIRVLEFTYDGFPPYEGGVAETEQARSLLPLVDLGHPFRKRAKPLAAVTGRIQLSVSVEGSHPIVKNLILYADALVADAEAKDFYYRVDNRLHQQLQRLRLHRPHPPEK
jgi:hypothetical protein